MVFTLPKLLFGLPQKKSILSKKEVLIKTNFWLSGNDIKMIETKKDLKKISPIGSVFYLQEFIESEKKNYSDIRVLVSNHKIVSAMERVSNHYITNVFKGATCKK